MSFYDSDAVERAAERRDSFMSEDYAGHHEDCPEKDRSPMLGHLAAEYGCECEDLRRRDRINEEADRADDIIKDEMGG